LAIALFAGRYISSMSNSVAPTTRRCWCVPGGQPSTCHSPRKDDVPVQSVPTVDPGDVRLSDATICKPRQSETTFRKALATNSTSFGSSADKKTPNTFPKSATPAPTHPLLGLELDDRLLARLGLEFLAVCINLDDLIDAFVLGKIEAELFGNPRRDKPTVLVNVPAPVESWTRGVRTVHL